MIELKFNVTIDDDKISKDSGKVSALVDKFNAHLERMQDAGTFEEFVRGDKRIVVFIPDWLEAGTQTCFAWTSEDVDDAKGFLEALAKFPQIFVKIIPTLPL